jgi:probable F420-dependent oxidoreductase
MARFTVGVLLKPQHCRIDQMREAWRAADDLGVDSVWTWDHFYPLYGDPDGPNLECWTTLAAIAADTTRVRFGSLVTCHSFRNPGLLAAMADNVNKLSDGRLILGLGAGWFEREYVDYGYEFGTAGDRLRALESGLTTIHSRLSGVPLLIGGGGEKVTLRIVAEQADLWNDFGSVEKFQHKNAVLDEWCATVGRDPAAIERTTMIDPPEVETVDAYLKAGATHIILGLDAPFDLSPLRQLLALAAD